MVENSTLPLNISAKTNCTNPLCLSDASIVWALNEAQAKAYIPAISFVGLLLVCSLIGNGLVVYIYHTKLNVTTANIFIKWLAMFDILCCMTGMPNEIFDMRFHYVYVHEVPCRLLRFIEMFANVASGLTLMCVAIDRYYHVCKPLKIFTKRKAYKMMVIVLMMALLITWPTGMVFGVKTVDVLNGGLLLQTCSIGDTWKDTTVPVVFYVWLTIINFCSTTFLSVMYIRIGIAISKWKRMHIGEQLPTISRSNMRERPKIPSNRKFHKQGGNSIKGCRSNGSAYQNSNRNSKQISNHPANILAPERQQTSTRTTVMLFTVTVAYVVSYIPHLVIINLTFTKILDPSNLSLIYRQLLEIAAKSFFLNNAVNPFIYAALLPKFRTEVKRLFQNSRT